MTIDELLDRLGFRPEDEKQLLAFAAIVILGILLFLWALQKDPTPPHGEIKATVSSRSQDNLDQLLKEELCKESAVLLGGDIKVNQQEISYGEVTYKDGCWHQSATMKWKR